MTHNEEQVHLWDFSAMRDVQCTPDFPLYLQAAIRASSLSFSMSRFEAEGEFGPIHAAIHSINTNYGGTCRRNATSKQWVFDTTPEIPLGHKLQQRSRSCTALLPMSGPDRTLHYSFDER